MSELIERSRAIFESLSIAALKAAGIWPAPDYELVFNYPPYHALGPIEPENMFNPEDRGRPRSVAVYVHLPFCQSICAYCHYCRWVLRDASEINDYLDLLARELATYGRILGQGSLTAQSLHLGGGTPSLLSLKQLDRLLTILKGTISFPEWPQNIEMTAESNPSSFRADWLAGIRQMGFNRLNIGVQAFEDRLLRVCRRPHNAEGAIRAIMIAREAGFENVNVDLMFGLPTQTFEDWERTLETIISLRPASVTCYKLRRKRGTRFGRLRPEDLPTVEDQLVMHIMAVEALTDAGYFLWHFETLFVRDPKYSHRHQEHKWGQAGDILGLGISAYGYLNGYTYYNLSLPGEYQERVNHGRLPIEIGHRLDLDELQRRRLIFGLTQLHVDERAFRQQFGISPIQTFPKKLRLLEKLGLITFGKGQTIDVTRYPGLLFVMEMMTAFYSPIVKQVLAAKGIHYGSSPILSSGT